MSYHIITTFKRNTVNYFSKIFKYLIFNVLFSVEKDVQEINEKIMKTC